MAKTDLDENARWPSNFRDVWACRRGLQKTAVNEIETEMLLVLIHKLHADPLFPFSLSVSTYVGVRPPSDVKSAELARPARDPSPSIEGFHGLSYCFPE